MADRVKLLGRTDARLPSALLSLEEGRDRGIVSELTERLDAIPCVESKGPLGEGDGDLPGESERWMTIGGSAGWFSLRSRCTLGKASSGGRDV